MDLLRPFRQCVICKKHIHYVGNPPHHVVPLIKIWHFGNSVWWYYHQNCLLEALQNPETFNSDQVQIALKIDDLLREQEAHQRWLLEQRSQEIQEAHRRATAHFANPALRRLLDQTAPQLKNRAPQKENRAPQKDKSKNQNRYQILKGGSK